MDGFLLLAILIAVAGFAWGIYEAKIKGSNTQMTRFKHTN